jgi:hypothetical protein
MASKPFFSSEFGITSQVATFTIVRNSVSLGAINVTIPVDRYYLGASTNSLNIVRTLIIALNAVSGLGTFQYNVLSTSDNLGLSCSLSYDDTSEPTALTNLSFTTMNAVAVDLFWAIGFRNVSTINFTVVADMGTALTTGIPKYTWFPKAFSINQDDYSTVTQQAQSSRLAGSGSLVSSVRQDNGVIRWWRSWRMTQVAAARCSYPKAISTYSPEWATIAGLTTNPGDAALDKENGWWQRTCAGQYRFAVIEDESDATTPNWDIYRIINDDDQPINMNGWKGLRSPNVTVYSTAGATRTVELCALASRVGDL